MGAVRALVGGVGELYQGDLDLGRRAVERLGHDARGEGVLVEELYYGAVAVLHRLRELRPASLIVVGAAERARPPGTVERRRVREHQLPIEEVQLAVWEGSTGFVSIDLLLQVAGGFGALPGHTVAIEVEPARHGPSEFMSAEAETGLDAALALVRAELRRLPLLELADRLRGGAQAATEDQRALLGELELVDREGSFGAAFGYRDRVRRTLAADDGRSELWRALLEELDRLEPWETVSDT